MNNLKDILFTSTFLEGNKLLKLERTSNNEAEKEITKQCFCALYSVIEEAELEEEYTAWVWGEAERGDEYAQAEKVAEGTTGS